MTKKLASKKPKKTHAPKVTLTAAAVMPVEIDMSEGYPGGYERAITALKKACRNKSNVVVSVDTPDGYFEGVTTSVSLSVDE